MPSHRFLQYDVFTATPLTGNQLAVVPDARGLSAETMQDVAREMNFSETTFVLPPEREDTLCRVRIFTPGGELPMAGHPTIGTTFALAHEGRIPPGTPRIVLGLGVGPTPVALEWQEAAPAFAWMTQGRPEFGAMLGPRDALARSLGLADTDLARVSLPARVVSCGVPFAIVPLASREAVDRAELDRAAWRSLCRECGLDEQKAFIFAIEDATAGALAVYSRMFAPVLAVPEDPGTGSASGPLGAYLVEHGVSPGRQHAFVSRQGVKMRRPCEIRIRITGTPGAIARVEVGGAAVCVADGTMRF